MNLVMVRLYNEALIMLADAVRDGDEFRRQNAVRHLDLVLFVERTCAPFDGGPVC